MNDIDTIPPLFSVGDNDPALCARGCVKRGPNVPCPVCKRVGVQAEGRGLAWAFSFLYKKIYIFRKKAFALGRFVRPTNKRLWNHGLEGIARSSSPHGNKGVISAPTMGLHCPDN